MLARGFLVLVESLLLVQSAHPVGDQAGPLAQAVDGAPERGQLEGNENGAASGFTLPLKPKSVRFGVIGDSGTGEKKQYEVGQEMAAYHEKISFDFVIMLGDNIYGGKSPADFKRKFEDPYRPLLDAGVKFYASLGNHDDPNERFYKPFNMDGKRFYSFKNGKVEFFALDSNYMDPEQLGWLRKELQNSNATWKICYFHHPLYSAGKFHGPDLDLRKLLEPIFEKNGVNVVISGHEHLYERIKPQNGIYYFVLGNSGELRSHNLKQSAETAKGFDTDRAFMLVEIAEDELYFQTVSRTGETVDSGVLEKQTMSALPGSPT
jgi:predicted phosphodiesterase